MVRRTRQDKKTSDDGFLSRWSARKAQIARGELTLDEKPIGVAEKIAEGNVDVDEDAGLSDQELLKKYELPDPEDVADESGLTQFLESDLPERLRQMALRRLWRLNPLFGQVCDMVEYGEDYTDAATVLEGMQTAYQVGKGYETKAAELDELSEREVRDSGLAESEVQDNGLEESEVQDNGLEESEVQDSGLAESEVQDSGLAESEVQDNGLAESEVQDSEPAGDEPVESEGGVRRFGEKIVDEFEDGAVFKDNAIGVGGVGVHEYILPVNDISVPQVDQTEKKKNDTAVEGHPAVGVKSVDDVEPFQDVSEVSEKDEGVSKLGSSEQNANNTGRPSRMRFIRPEAGSKI